MNNTLSSYEKGPFCFPNRSYFPFSDGVISSLIDVAGVDLAFEVTY
jgi:hypothetical protein